MLFRYTIKDKSMVDLWSGIYDCENEMHFRECAKETMRYLLLERHVNPYYCEYRKLSARKVKLLLFHR